MNNKLSLSNSITPCSLSIFTSDNANLNKKFTFEDGEIVKTAGANLSQGTFEIQPFTSASELNHLFNGLLPNQAVSIGLPHLNGEELTLGRIVSKKINELGAINRTLDYFRFGNTFYFDLDDCDLAIEEVISTLTKIDPSLATATLLVRASSSFGVHRDDADASTFDANGYHVWVLGIKDGRDIARYGNVFAKRCWLAGLGYIKTTEKSLLVRQIIDAAVFSPERLVFEAKPTLEQGLVQSEVPSIIQEGGVFDTALLPDLNSQEQAYYDFLVSQAKQPFLQEAEAVSASNDSGQYEVLEKPVSSNPSINLSPSHMLYFDIFGPRTVREVLFNLTRFDKATLSDPSEPEHNGGRNVAIFYANEGNNASPVIFSQAYGGLNYYFENIPHLISNSDVDLALHITSAVASNTLHRDNVAVWLDKTMEECNLPSKSESYLIETIIKQLKLGKVKTSLKNEVKKARQKRLEASHSAHNRNGIYVPTELHQKLDINLFPDVEFINDKAIVVATIENLKSLLKNYGITYSYDVISKNQQLDFPDGNTFCDDIADNAKLVQVKSLCRQNGMPANAVEYLSALFGQSFINPVVDYLSSLQWDGQDHIKTLVDSVVVTKHSQELWPIVLTRWLIQCVASADNARQTSNKLAVAKFEYCLVLVGSQGISKTAFFNQIIPPALKSYFADGLRLDLSNKDSIKQAISNWIVELGEIDSTFSKSSVSQLKAFLSQREDTIRRPYDATESHFKRRTSFCGSVNDVKFLADKTGNRRFYPIEVKSIQIPLTVDIEQVWAQVWNLYHIQGEQFWPDEAMSALLDRVSGTHLKDSAVRESLLAEFDLEQSGDSGELHTFKAIREKLELPNSNNVISEIRQILENEFKIQKKIIRGTNGYRLLARSLSNEG